MSRKSLFAMLGPGILVAATGVGAGDLATAAFAGSKLGVAVLWAVVLGAGIKYLLTEGLTRWQLATGDTLLEGSMSRLGRPAQYIFLIYLLLWSFMVAAALMSANVEWPPTPFCPSPIRQPPARSSTELSSVFWAFSWSGSAVTGSSKR